MRERSSRPYIDLLDSVAVTAREQSAAFRQIRLRLSEIREWFLDRTGWPVILTRDMVRLVKTPALSHPGQGFAWAKEPLDYELLLWVLWYGERLSSDQFVLTDLVRELEVSVAARIGHTHLNWDQRPHRASLKRVLDALEEMQALRRLDGVLEGFVERREGDSLYEFTFLASHFRVNLVGQANGTLDRTYCLRTRNTGNNGNRVETARVRLNRRVEQTWNTGNRPQNTRGARSRCMVFERNRRPTPAHSSFNCRRSPDILQLPPSQPPRIRNVEDPFSDNRRLRAEIEVSRLGSSRRTGAVCMTFARVAETALGMGHREHGPRTIASAEKGYSDMLRYFSHATGMTLEVARELLEQFRQLRERLDGLQRPHLSGYTGITELLNPT